MTADLLQRLADAGTPMSLIMEVAETLAEARAAERLLDKRREKDRLRKRHVSVDSAESSEPLEPAELPPPDKSPPNPQKLTPPPTHTGSTPARKAGPFPRPDWADPDVWEDLLTNRRKKNLPNTASAHRKLLADIDKLVDANWPPGRVLEAAVSRGWGAIYASCKDEDDGRNRVNRGGGQRLGGHQRSDGLSPTTRAARDVFGIAASH